MHILDTIKSNIKYFKSNREFKKEHKKYGLPTNTIWGICDDFADLIYDDASILLYGCTDSFMFTKGEKRCLDQNIEKREKKDLDLERIRSLIDFKRIEAEYPLVQDIEPYDKIKTYKRNEVVLSGKDLYISRFDENKKPLKSLHWLKVFPYLLYIPSPCRSLDGLLSSTYKSLDIPEKIVYYFAKLFRQSHLLNVDDDIDYTKQFICEFADTIYVKENKDPSYFSHWKKLLEDTSGKKEFLEIAKRRKELWNLVYENLWQFDVAKLAKWLKPRIILLKKFGHGYPSEYKSPEAWNKDLDKMINGLEKDGEQLSKEGKKVWKLILDKMENLYD